MYIYKEEEFGTVERIKEWLSQQKKTREWFAEKIGVDPRTVNRWFNGSRIKPTNLKIIADLMECDIEYLECKQNQPRKNNHNIKLLNDLNKWSKYLYKVCELVKGTNKEINFTINIKNDSYEVINDTFIDGDKRYYFEDSVPSYDGDIVYSVNINGEIFEKTSLEMEGFVKRIMRFVSFEIENLKD